MFSRTQQDEKCFEQLVVSGRISHTSLEFCSSLRIECILNLQKQTFQTILRPFQLLWDAQVANMNYFTPWVSHNASQINGNQTGRGIGEKVCCPSQIFLSCPTWGLNSVRDNLHACARNAIFSLKNFLAFLFDKMPVTHPNEMEMTLTDKKNSG